MEVTGGSCLWTIFLRFQSPIQQSTLVPRSHTNSLDAITILDDCPDFGWLAVDRTDARLDCIPLLDGIEHVIFRNFHKITRNTRT